MPGQIIRANASQTARDAPDRCPDRIKQVGRGHALGDEEAAVDDEGLAGDVAGRRTRKE